jgi:WD40 repeat protein/serine/threonine protein kinase
MQRPGCPSRQQLSAYLLGTLPEDETDRLIRHVEGCPECETTVQTLESTADSLVAQVRRPEPDDPFFQEPECRKALDQAVEIGLQLQVPDESAAEASDLGSLGQYRLLEKLGQGGMGTVYRARHVKLDRVVALKVLPKHRMSDDRAVSRFEREMKAVGRLDHPNIVRATDAGELDGTPFLVMEYVDGWDLGELVRHLGPLPIGDACVLIRHAAVGLQAAHEHGMVHRDIKPSNLMLTRAGELKVLDLGLARLQADQPVGEEMTATGQAIGTADYMAPEQASDSHTVDIRADIYSLGCTLYKLLSGQAPFSGLQYRTNLEKMLAHVQKPVPPIQDHRGDVPEELVAVLDCMLAKDPAARYADPSEVADALAPFCPACDLPGLLARAEETAKVRAGADKLLGSTDEFPSSALAGTHPSHAPQPLAVRPPTRRHWKPLAIAAVVAGFALLGVVLTLTNRYGTLVVETEDPNVQIAVKQRGKLVEILNAESGWAIRLKSGEYEVEMQSGKDRFEIERDNVTVKRGEDVRVRITLKRPPATDEESPRGKPGEASKAVLVKVEPEPRELKPGEPLSGCALVARPAELPGVKSWTLETVGHRSRVLCVTYSPGGKWIASAGDDGSIRLFSAGTGQLVRILVGHAGSVSALSWSPDGQILASAGSEDKTIRFWNAEAGQLLRTSRLQADNLEVVPWSPDGKKLAYGAPGLQIGLWDVEGNRPARSFGNVEGWLAWSPDGKTLAAAARDGKINLWDVESGGLALTLEAPWPITRFAWSPDGKLIAAAPRGAVRLWDTRTGAVLRDLPAAGCPEESPPAFSPDGKVLAAAAENDTILRWEVDSFEPLPPVRTGHQWAAASMAWSPDGKRIVVGDLVGSVRIVDLISEKLVRAYPGYVGYRGSADVDLGWSPDGQALAVAILPTGRVRVLSAADGGAARRSADVPQPSEVSWSPDGSMLAVESAEDVVVLSSDLYERLGGFKIQPTDRSILAWSPSSRYLARGCDRNHYVELYEVNSKKVQELRGHRDAICSMAWSPDAKLLATGSRNDKILLFDGESGTPARALEGHSGAILFLEWSGDGSLLASASDEDTVRIWTVETGQFVAQKVNHVPSALAFSQDHRYLACGTEAAGEIGCIVWDVASAQTLYRLDCRSPKLLGFSPSGEQLTAIGADGTLWRWSLASGKLTTERQTHPSHSLLTEWSPDHKLVASFAPGMGVHLWRSQSGDPSVAIVLLGTEILHVSPSGHYRTTPGLDADKELVYVVQTDQNQETLTPREFASKYGWKNDQQKVRPEQTAHE